MKREDIIQDWINTIESINVGNFTRKVITRKVNDLGGVVSLSADLTDLSNEKEELCDYKSQKYSKYCFDFINIFIEKMKLGEIRNNTNWTYIEFYGEDDKQFAYVEYKTFNFVISTDYHKYVELTREKKLKELGL